MVSPLALLTVMAATVPSVPDFDPARSLISDLSLGESRWLGSLFCLLSALTLAAFSVGISPLLAPLKEAAAVSGLLYGAAVCLILLVFIDIDHVSGVWTLKRVVHWVIATLAAGSFAGAALMTMAGLRRSPAWRQARVFTAALVIAMLAAALLLALPVEKGRVAVLERIFLAGGLLWIEYMCLRVLTLPSGSLEAEEPEASGG
jgi:drug/metabolite transporter (DMT)-like permease